MEVSTCLWDSLKYPVIGQNDTVCCRLGGRNWHDAGVYVIPYNGFQPISPYHKVKGEFSSISCGDSNLTVVVINFNDSSGDQDFRAVILGRFFERIEQMVTTDDPPKEICLIWRFTNQLDQIQFKHHLPWEASGLC